MNSDFHKANNSDFNVAANTAIHKKQPVQWDWFNIFFLAFFHVMAIGTTAAFFYFESLSWPIIALSVVFYFLTGLSITAGYHRLFAHLGYDAHPALQLLYLIFGAAAFENSALKWCTDHRVHHRFVDKKEDPYNINEGFFHAHIGWICKKSHVENAEKYQRDMVKNKWIMWQHRNYITIAIASGVVLPALVGWMLGSWLGGLALAGFLRICMVHHFTFFINSYAHYWGKQTFTDENTAKDSFLLALFTYGEGYHNFHHLFQNDYRNGIRWYDYDPTKWVIKSMNYIGMASNLKKTPELKILQAKMNMRKKTLEQSLLTADFKTSLLATVEPMRIKVESAYIRFCELKEHYQTEFLAFKQNKTEAGYAKIAQIKAELRAARIEYKQSYAQWKLYSGALLKGVPS